MRLIWDSYHTDKYRPSPSWFIPDRIEHFTHDAPNNCNIGVYSALGEPVCGRVVENSVGTYRYVLAEDYKLVG